MNTEYIFKLFNDSLVHKSDDEIEKEIMESAHYNSKMFIKYITNLKNFQLKLLMMASKDSERDLISEKEQAEAIGFVRAFNYVSKVNFYDKNHVNDLDLINPYDFAYCLQLSKKYFLRVEDYDKVAFLVDMLDFVEKRYENLVENLSVE